MPKPKRTAAKPHDEEPDLTAETPSQARSESGATESNGLSSDDDAAPALETEMMNPPSVPEPPQEKVQDKSKEDLSAKEGRNSGNGSKSKKDRATKRGRSPAAEDSASLKQSTGTPPQQASPFAGWLTTATVAAASSNVLCGLGVHPLGAGVAAESLSEPPLIDARDAIATFPGCGHTACRSCVVAEASASVVVSRLSGTAHSAPSTVASTALEVRCPTCDRAAALPATSAEDGDKEVDVVGRRVDAVFAKANAEATAAVAAFWADRQRFVTASAAAAEGSSSSPCGICEEGAGTVECVDCGFALCDDCAATVHKRGRFRQHRVVPRVSPTQAPSPLKSGSGTGDSFSRLLGRGKQYCSEHPGYPLELFCRTCSACACLRCVFSGAHKDHDATPLADVAESLVTELRDAVATAGDAETALLGAVAAVKQGGPAVDSAVAAATASVDAEFERLQELLAAKRAELVASVQSWADDRHATLSRDQAALEATHGALRGVIAGCETLASQLPVTSVLALRGILVRRVAAVTTTPLCRALVSNSAAVQSVTDAATQVAEFSASANATQRFAALLEAVGTFAHAGEAPGSPLVSGLGLSAHREPPVRRSAGSVPAPAPPAVSFGKAPSLTLGSFDRTSSDTTVGQLLGLGRGGTDAVRRDIAEPTPAVSFAPALASQLDGGAQSAAAQQLQAVASQWAGVTGAATLGGRTSGTSKSVGFSVPDAPKPREASVSPAPEPEPRGKGREGKRSIQLGAQTNARRKDGNKGGGSNFTLRL